MFSLKTLTLFLVVIAFVAMVYAEAEDLETAEQRHGGFGHGGGFGRGHGGGGFGRGHGGGFGRGHGGGFGRGHGGGHGGGFGRRF